MAAKGSILKEEITNELLNSFEGAFLCNGGKELRIQGLENGEIIQIKVALTCAKVNVEAPSNIGISTAKAPSVSTANIDCATPMVNAEPTAAEQQNLATLLERLGINP